MREKILDFEVNELLLHPLHKSLEVLVVHPVLTGVAVVVENNFSGDTSALHFLIKSLQEKFIAEVSELLAELLISDS